MPRKKKSYVVCLENEGYEAALEPRKLYLALGDPGGEEPGFLRVVDESGEDYLYPQSFFEAIEVPRKVARVFAASA
jgi:hypothetical protein